MPQQMEALLPHLLRLQDAGIQAERSRRPAATVLQIKEGRALTILSGPTNPLEDTKATRRKWRHVPTALL